MLLKVFNAIRFIKKSPVIFYFLQIILFIWSVIHMILYNLPTLLLLLLLLLILLLLLRSQRWMIVACICKEYCFSNDSIFDECNGHLYFGYNACVLLKLLLEIISRFT